MKDKKVMWYDNGNTIVNLIIGMILIIIICSQSFVTTHGSSLELFSSIINHNSVYLFILVYFIFLKLSIGKKYFNYSNILLVFIYILTTFTSFLTLIQAFSLNTILDFVINIILLGYLIHTMFRDTTLWKGLHLNKSPFNEIDNEFSYYSILVISVFYLVVNLISTVVISGVVIAVLDTIYYILFGRYIYLYHEYLDKKKIGVKGLGNFDDIREKINDTTKSMEKEINDFVKEKEIDKKIDEIGDKIGNTAKDVKKEIDDFIEEKEIDKKIEDTKKKVVKKTKKIKKDVEKKVKGDK